MYDVESKNENFAATTRAEYSDETDDWELNGAKAFVLNPKIANLYIVFARTVSKNMLGDMDNTITAFIVDAKSPGVTIEDEEPTIGHCEVQKAAVQFNKVRVPSRNVLGKISGGQKVGKKLLVETRLHLASLCVTQMKNLLNQVIEHCEKDEEQQAIAA